MAPAPRIARHLGSCLIALALPATVAAQDPPGAGQAPPTPGGAVVQKVEQGPAVGFAMKFVSVGGDDALFAGASGGYVFDGKLLVGGAGYMRLDRSYPGTQTTCEWGLLIVIPVAQCSEQMVNESGDFYGGLVVGWRALRGDRVSLSVGGLVGGGLVKIGWDGSQRVVNPVVPAAGSHSSAEEPYLYDQAYLVFEPQIDVAVALAGPVVLAGSAGYRVIGSANGLEDHLKGMTASVSFRVRIR